MLLKQKSQYKHKNFMKYQKMDMIKWIDSPKTLGRAGFSKTFQERVNFENRICEYKVIKSSLSSDN